jgi:hypothetical protein
LAKEKRGGKRDAQPESEGRFVKSSPPVSYVLAFQGEAVAIGEPIFSQKKVLTFRLELFSIAQRAVFRSIVSLNLDLTDEASASCLSLVVGWCVVGFGKVIVDFPRPEASLGWRCSRPYQSQA